VIKKNGAHFFYESGEVFGRSNTSLRKYNVEFSSCSPGPTNEVYFHIPAPQDAT
jgi:hypothetical protein